MHKDLVLSADYDSVVRTLVYSGRPMSVRKTDFVAEWFAPFALCIVFGTDI
jgi:NAD(P)H-dependent flavin oxidoreductase YrpB (nitropropane dioxygenase family)